MKAILMMIVATVLLVLAFAGIVLLNMWLICQALQWIFPTVELHGLLLPATLISIACIAVTLGVYSRLPSPVSGDYRVIVDDDDDDDELNDPDMVAAIDELKRTLRGPGRTRGRRKH